MVETFLQLKQQFDPEMRLQSDLFRRLFQPRGKEKPFASAHLHPPGCAGLFLVTCLVWLVPEMVGMHRQMGKLQGNRI